MYNCNFLHSFSLCCTNNEKPQTQHLNVLKEILLMGKPMTDIWLDKEYTKDKKKIEKSELLEKGKSEEIGQKVSQNYSEPLVCPPKEHLYVKGENGKWVKIRKKYIKKKKYLISIEKIKEYQKNHQLKHRMIKEKVFEHYGSKCSCCSESHIEVLTIDHIYGNGAEHRREINNNGSFYEWLIKNNFPSGFQTLCWNCNFAKGKKRYCPIHHPEKNQWEDYGPTWKWDEYPKNPQTEKVKRARQRAKEKVFEHYGTKCSCPECKENNILCLTIDHIYGGGGKHRKELGNKSIYKWLVQNNFPSGFQTLCYNCNFAKGSKKCCPVHGETKEIADVDDKLLGGR